MYVALSLLSCVTNKETEAQTGQITGLESGAGQERSRPEGLSGSLSPRYPTMCFASPFHVQVVEIVVSSLFFSWGISFSPASAKLPPSLLFGGKRGLFNFFVFTFGQIQLLFHKDLGQVGETGGLEVFEGKVDVHTQSHGGGP